MTTIVVTTVLLLLTSANGAAADRPWVVAYLVRGSGDICKPEGCEWRVYRPDTDEDILVTVLPEFPHAVIWGDRFERVEYRAGRRLYRMRWAPGARPELLGILPETWNPAFVDNEPWVDRESGAWRVLIAEGRGADYRTRVLELKTSRQWRTVAEAVGCGSLDNACWAPVRQAKDRRVFNSAAGLLDVMRMPTHMPRARFDRKPADERDEVPVQVPSKTVHNRALRMRVVLGDDWHALAPLTWLEVNTQRTRVIPSAGGECNDGTVAFDERGPFLLVVGEWTGRCAVVVDMRSSALRRRFPSASLAVWVRGPAGRWLNMLDVNRETHAAPWLFRGVASLALVAPFLWRGARQPRAVQETFVLVVKLRVFEDGWDDN